MVTEHHLAASQKHLTHEETFGYWIYCIFLFDNWSDFRLGVIKCSFFFWQQFTWGEMAHGFLTLLILARLLSNNFSNLASFIGKSFFFFLHRATDVYRECSCAWKHSCTFPRSVWDKIQFKDGCSTVNFNVLYVFGQGLCMHPHLEPAPCSRSSATILSGYMPCMNSYSAHKCTFL